MKFLVRSAFLSLLFVALLVTFLPKTSSVNNLVQRPRIRQKNGTSSNWSGYAVETNLLNPQDYAVSNVSGDWVVPQVSCSQATSNTYSSTWLGIDGYSDNTVEQIGTEQDCIKNLGSYYAWFEMYPHLNYKVSLAIHPGDSMTAEVKYIGANKYTLYLKDVSTSKSFQTTQRLNSLRQSAEWIVEAPWSGGVLPLADFNNVNFTNVQAMVNNQQVSITNPSVQNDQIFMLDDSGNTKAAPGATSNNGSSFTDYFYNSN